MTTRGGPAGVATIAGAAGGGSCAAAAAAASDGWSSLSTASLRALPPSGEASSLSSSGWARFLNEPRRAGFFAGTSALSSSPLPLSSLNPGGFSDQATLAARRAAYFWVHSSTSALSFCTSFSQAPRRNPAAFMVPSIRRLCSRSMETAASIEDGATAPAADAVEPPATRCWCCWCCCCSAASATASASFADAADTTLACAPGPEESAVAAPFVLVVFATYKPIHVTTANETRNRSQTCRRPRVPEDCPDEDE
jgi:hypothetical protein